MPPGHLGPVDLDHANDGLPTNGTEVDLPSAGHTSTHVPAIVEQGILLLTVADLAEVHLLVGDLPVTDAFTVALAVLVAANVLVAGLFLHE